MVSRLLDLRMQDHSVIARMHMSAALEMPELAEVGQPALRPSCNTAETP